MVSVDSTLGIVSLSSVILSAVIPIYSFAMPLADPVPDSYHSQFNLDLMRRQNGNPGVAGDLYGLGLRVGAYLQIFGMLLSCLRKEKHSRVGIRLLSASVCLSLFTAWTILVVRRSISPCEAWLIISLGAAYGVPRYCALSGKAHPKGGIAMACCLASILWQQIVYFWFFTTLYRQLPLLGTSNTVWLFAPVDVTGWFRIFMVVATCVEAVVTPFSIGPYLDMILGRFYTWSDAEDFEGKDRDKDVSSEPRWVRSFVFLGRRARGVRKNKYFHSFATVGDNIICYFTGDTPLDQIAGKDLEKELEKTKEGNDKLRVAMTVWGFIVLVLTIAGIEKIIEYNSLSPTSDLAQPGQIIPLILGIITFIVGASHAIKPKPGKPDSSDDESSTSGECHPAEGQQYDDSGLTAWLQGENIEMIDVVKEAREAELKAKTSFGQC